MKKIIEKIIFSSRWILIPFYLGLMIVMCLYTIVFIKEIFHLIEHIQTLNKEIIMLTILEIVDIVMIANLVKMIITGSYNSFVSKTHGEQGENISSGALKVKMTTSLVGVSSIHLLQSFINISIVDAHTTSITWADLNKQLLIHGTFVIGALILAIIDYLHVRAEKIEKTKEEYEEEFFKKLGIITNKFDLNEKNKLHIDNATSHK